MHTTNSLASVLVTGGGRRLGSVICQAFARAGWRVWCQYRASRSEAQALCESLCAEGHLATAIEADITTDEGRAALMAQVSSPESPLQCVVNNAASFVPDTGLDFEAESALTQINVNLVAPLALARLLACGAASDSKLDRCAIHVLDQKVYNLNPDYFSYTISKLALERAIQLQAMSFAGRARVCGVAPGLMFPSGPQDRANFEIASRANPLNRAIDPADVASACLQIASTRGMNGATITVDNGQHLVPLDRDIMFIVEDSMKRRE